MSDKLEIGNVYRHRRDGGEWKVIRYHGCLAWLSIKGDQLGRLGGYITRPSHKIMSKWGDRVYQFKEYYNLTKK